MSLISKAFSDIITFSRSSNATRVGPDGKVQYAPHNLATYSEQFDNAAWSKLNTTVTANAVASPNGTVTADKIVETAVTAAFLVYQTGVASGGTYTLSIYAKAAERSKFALEFASVGYEAVFDLSAGTVYSTTSSTATITSMGNGWYRCSATAAIASSSTVAIGIRDASGNRSYAGTTGSGIYGWGAQLSVGSIAGDYTPTTSAAVYGPRFDYDPVTLAAKGLLIEEQRTNLLTYSEDFTNGAYINGRVTITANTAAAPDGTTTADSLTQSGSTTSGYVAGYSTNSGTNTYTFSVFAKPNGKNFVRLTEALSGSDRSTYFNLSTGTVGTKDAAHTASITAYANGWYRVAITYSGSGASYYPGIYLADTDNSSTVVASGGLYIWGIQVELGTFPTSYIPTVASTVTRSADVASVNTLSPWFNAVEGTLFAQFDESINSSSITNQVFASLNDGTANNEMLLYRSGGGFDARFAILTSGALQADVATSVTLAQNTAYKTAGAYKLNDIAASTSGNTPGTDTSATIPTVSALQIGGGRSTTAFSGHLRRLAYYPRRLTNAELQALTA